MTEPKQPIPLDYKTPEKGERVTAWMAILRIIAAFLGMVTLMLAIPLSAYTIWIVFGAITSGQIDPIRVTPYLGVLALLAWFITILSLTYAIVGNRKSRSASIGSDE